MLHWIDNKFFKKILTVSWPLRRGFVLKMKKKKEMNCIKVLHMGVISFFVQWRGGGIFLVFSKGLGEKDQNRKGPPWLQTTKKTDFFNCLQFFLLSLRSVQFGYEIGRNDITTKPHWAELRSILMKLFFAILIRMDIKNFYFPYTHFHIYWWCARITNKQSWWDHGGRVV